MRTLSGTCEHTSVRSEQGHILQRNGVRSNQSIAFVRSGQCSSDADAEGTVSRFGGRTSAPRVS